MSRSPATIEGLRESAAEDIEAARLLDSTAPPRRRRVGVDRFIADTPAPSFGLYLVPVPSGIAYEVRRAADDEHLFTGDRVQVRLFLRGYGAALGHPALRDLADAIADEDTGNGRILDVATAVAAVVPGGAS